MRKLSSFRGITALVTGASSGIGRLLALRLADEGARVALVARREAALEEVAAAIRERSGEALVVPCDVAERAQVFAAGERVAADFGAVDLLVNNAGFGDHRSFLDADLDAMERLVRVNFLGSLHWTKALLPAMVERERGWITFMASVAGKIASPGEAIYAASKFAMVGFAAALSMEVEDRGVHVLTVCPGAVRTDFFDAETLAAMPAVSQRSMVEPERLIDAIVKALAAGKREITFPRAIASAYVVGALVPGLLRSSVKRVTRGASRRRRRTP
jgi:short-subunit dehydrogenase